MAHRDLDEHLPAIAGGDADAFARWLAAAEAPLRRSLRTFAANVDTEAVLQESLLRVWQVAPRCEPDGRPNGLLRLAQRVARNLAIDALRRQRAAHVELLEGDLPTIEPQPVDEHVRDTLRRCRNKLPERPAQALDARLHDRELRNDRELASALDMQLNTFLQNITRARRLLAECLQRHGVQLKEVTT